MYRRGCSRVGSSSFAVASHLHHPNNTTTTAYTTFVQARASVLTAQRRSFVAAAWMAATSSAPSSSAPSTLMSSRLSSHEARASPPPSSDVSKSFAQRAGSGGAGGGGGATGGDQPPRHPSPEVNILRKEVSTLLTEIQQRDELIAQLRAKVARLESQQQEGEAQSSPAAAAATTTTPKPQLEEQPLTYPAEAHVVSTTAELLAAFDARRPLVALAAGASFHVPDGLVVPLAGSMPIAVVGPVNCPPARRPVLEANVRVVAPSGKPAPAKFSMADIVVRSPADSAAEPCLSIAGTCQADISRCAFERGRDGLYLTGTATAVISDCRIACNVRGVFESLRCRVTLRGNQFEKNQFHCVLLAPPAEATADRASRVAKEVTAGNNSFIGGRCDVALTHNPIEDRYGNTFRGGVAVQLSDDESAGGLVDAVFGV